MVDLDPLDELDRQELRNMIVKHLEYTGSTPAYRILDHWKETASSFVKVMPRDYKIVLNAKKAKSQNRSAVVE
jgi:glutamate synthase (NADPH/NADH) large chain